MNTSIPIPGCRHDILGHNLKAIGLLRVLAACADAEHRDLEAEGWWDFDSACFRLRSETYKSLEELAGFLAMHYSPSQIISAWNNDIGYKDGRVEPRPSARTVKLAEDLSQQVKKETKNKRETTNRTFRQFREESDAVLPEIVDAIASIFTKRNSDNPLFLSKGAAGRAQLFRTYWEFFEKLTKARKGSNNQQVQALALASLTGDSATSGKSIGTPFFPDAIKTYNNGLGWVVDNFPFNALDYLLAVEGALALRGAASRTLAANSRRFAAFPFVFDSGEDLVDDSNEVKGTATSIWLPLWDRAATFAELSSFICDAQARLPGKEARFAAEFARALRAQGVDAGFSGWQEFRFKMKASRVPWVCTGRYLSATSDRHSLRLNDALAPLDESGFLDQFEPRYKGSKIDARSPHPIRASIGAAIEDTVVQPTPDNAMEILLRLYPACGKLAQSKSFRETLRQRAIFFDPLPMKQWEDLLEGFDSPEFRIAQALASITGFSKQANGKFSRVQPFLGSLLPLNLEYRNCRLEENSKQAVWSGTDLGHDLARVLSRRYLDSLDDERPAIMSPRPAPLEDILALLNGELDDHRIARWTEALSLIGWHFEKEEESADPSASSEEQSLKDEQRQFSAVPLAYAALRSVIEMECEWQGKDSSLWKKRRSHRPISLLCQRTPSSLALAVEDALRWLAIWGVPNCWGEATHREKPRLGGRDVIRADHRELNFGEPQSRLVTRFSAAVLIPLDWRDCGKLYRAVTLPQSIKH